MIVTVVSVSIWTIQFKVISYRRNYLKRLIVSEPPLMRLDADYGLLRRLAFDIRRTITCF